MEHLFFEVQLCSEILIFNEHSNFWYTDHPEKSALILQSAVFVVRTILCTGNDAGELLHALLHNPALVHTIKNIFCH